MPEEKLRRLLDSKILSRHYKCRDSEPYQKAILKLIIPELLIDEKKTNCNDQSEKVAS